MPVTQLYCEGSALGVDIRAISQIAPRGCLVKAVGSKNRLAGSVLADRSIKPSIAALVDRDFDCTPSVAKEQPIPLFEAGVQAGWTWERKEIENYLLDPGIIDKTWLPKRMFSLDDYQQALKQAAEKLKFYTAARTALSCFGFKNRWGSERRWSAARYTFPDNQEQQACRQEIERIVNAGKGDRIVTPANVIEKFEELLPSFSASGYRISNPLVYYSGKDLLCALKPSLDNWLPNPQKSIQLFTEHAITQLEKAETVWAWLPEWTALRELLESADAVANIL